MTETIKERHARLYEAADYGGPEAPWTPVPLGQIKEWFKTNPDAELETVFPTVYEEDRTSKIKDLATAQGLAYITHRRAAEQTAKELGLEKYDYEDEQEQIKQEMASVPQSGLAMGDAIASSVAG